MNKVNFDNLKNLKAPEEWIENAINIPNTEQKKKPILAIFSNKSARLIAAAACLVLISAVSLTIFLTQDSGVPPIDPNYEATVQTVETQAITQAESLLSAETKLSSSGGNTQDTTSSGESALNTEEYEKIEPTEAETYDTTQNANISNSETQTATSATPSPTRKPVTKPIVNETVRATEKTDATASDSTNNPSVKPTAVETISPTVKPTASPTQKPTSKPTAESTQAPTSKPTQAPTTKPTVEPTQAPTVKPTSKPNTPSAMLMLPTIPPPAEKPSEEYPQTPSEPLPTEPTEPPYISPSEPGEPPYISPSEPGESPYIEPATTPDVETTEPPFVGPTEPPYVEPTDSPTESTESTTNPNDLPHYVIDITNTTYCKLDEPICVGYIDPPVSSDDVFYCSVYDKNLNVIGYYGHYYYSDYLKASIKTYDSQRQQIRCEYSLKYREMVTSVGTYYYCFYNDKGKIVYWGKLVVYE